MPISPAPSTTARRAVAMASRRRTASSMLRSTWNGTSASPLTGGMAGAAPVASSSFS